MYRPPFTLSYNDIRTSVFCTAIFFISPIIALVILLIDVFNNRPFSHFCLSLILSSFCFTLIPYFEDDVTRWYELYQIGADTSWTAFIQDYKDKKDFLEYYYTYFLAYFDLPMQLIPFTSVFFSYFLWLKLGRELIASNEQLLTDSLKKILVFIFLAWIDYRLVSMGVRQWFASILTIYGAFCYLQKNYRLFGISLMVTASTIHSMTMIIPAFVFITHFCTIKMARLGFMMTLPFLFLPDIGIIDFISKLFPGSTLVTSTTAYTTGYWSGEYLDDLSLKGQIQRQLKNSPVYFLAIYLTLTHYKYPFRKLTYLTGSFVFIMSSLPMLFNRYGMLFTLFYPITFLLEFNKSGEQLRRNKHLLFIFFIAILIFLTTLYSFRASLITSLAGFVRHNGISLFANKLYISNFMTL